MTGSGSQIRHVLGSALLLLAMLVPAAAQERDFYRGKTITIIIPIGPGGAYDAYARLLSRHLARHLPGNPNVVPQNMPGGGGVIASTISTMSLRRWGRSRSSSRPLRPTSCSKIRRSVATPASSGDWPIARCNVGPVLLAPRRSRRCVIFKPPASVGITAVNDVPAYRLRAMNRLLDTKIKLVPGYPSARDFVLASERGETDGGTSTYIGLAQIFSSYLAEKKLNILVQFAARRDRLMSDIPTVMELTRDPQAIEVFRLLIATDRLAARSSQRRACRPSGSPCCDPHSR